MSQGWLALASSHTLAASRSLIMDMFDSCKSHFSGTSAPAPFVEGQCYYNTGDKYVYWRGAGGWHAIFQVTGAGGALLPRSGGASFPMTGNLFMGSHQIKNVANPSDNQDAATKGWTLNAIDSHYHTGGGGGAGPRISWHNLTCVSNGQQDSGQTLLQVAADKVSLENRHQNGIHYANEYYYCGVDVNETDILEVTVWAWQNERKYIHYGFRLEGGSGYITLRMYRDTTALWNYRMGTNKDHHIIIPYTYTGTAKNIVWKLTLQCTSTGVHVFNPYLFIS